MPPLKSTLDLDRRAALKALTAAASALMAGCSPPDEEIIPYVRMPEGMVAGEPMRFATTLTLAGYGRGFVAISVDGHPIKIEGNPGHPFSLGATDVFAEAAVMSLYDPSRSKEPFAKGVASTWNAFTADWEKPRSTGGATALVTGTIVSPTTLAQIDALRQHIPDLRWYRYEPINDDLARAGSRLAFGRVVQSLVRWEEADAVLLLDADPLGPGPDQLRIARAFASRRQTVEQRQRIFAAESGWTLSGAAADVRCPLHPDTIREVARSLANHLGADLGTPRLPDTAQDFARQVRAAFTGTTGRAIVLAGEGQSAEVHALAHWINQRMNAPVTTYATLDPNERDHAASLQAFADDLHNGAVSTLVVAEANPVYDAPSSLDLGSAIEKVPFSAHFGVYQNETAAHCTWHLPLSHGLEAWGDGRALDGTASLAQPLIKTLYDTRTIDEAFALLAGNANARSHDLTQTIWRPHAAGDFDRWWRQALNDGVIAKTEANRVTLGARLPDLPYAPEAAGFRLALSPDASLWDGRFASNPWLQECPKPFTRQVWGNAAQLAPADAAALGVADGDGIEVAGNGQTVVLPVVVTPGQAVGTVVTSLGHGRWVAGEIGSEVGIRVTDLHREPLIRDVAGITIAKSGREAPFYSPQRHTRPAGKAEDLLRTTSVSAIANAPPDHPALPPSTLPVPPRGDYAWGMVVNIDACIGCNACVVACQAENNVPIVGPAEIARGRDMHWLRVDGYALSGETERNGFQPVPCMHCELAPCEPVCPVEASVHDHEGLNVQVYNRCIGTRFCQANCPYKVRRFNWFAYAGEQAYGDQAEALRAQHNPDVSSRGRGVMEKCNYCLQRISRARHAAEREDRSIAEGEVVTACQAACPTRAISFGDLNRQDGAIARLRKLPQHYTLLEELNTRPRTTYLKRIFNDGTST